MLAVVPAICCEVFLPCKTNSIELKKHKSSIFIGLFFIQKNAEMIAFSIGSLTKEEAITNFE